METSPKDLLIRIGCIRGSAIARIMDSKQTAKLGLATASAHRWLKILKELAVGFKLVIYHAFAPILLISSFLFHNSLTRASKQRPKSSLLWKTSLSHTIGNKITTLIAIANMYIPIETPTPVTAASSAITLSLPTAIIPSPTSVTIEPALPTDDGLEHPNIPVWDVGGLGIEVSAS